MFVKLLKSILIGIGAFIVVVQQWHISVDERRARHWPSVEGHIVEADIVRIGARTGSPGPSAEVSRRRSVTECDGSQSESRWPTRSGYFPDGSRW
jgi:hypothetical protein